MRRCEDEKMRNRPPLLEEPCAQTLSGKTSSTCYYILSLGVSCRDILFVSGKIWEAPFGPKIQPGQGQFPLLGELPEDQKILSEDVDQKQPIFIRFHRFSCPKKFQAFIFHIFPASNLIFPTFSQLLLADFSVPDLGISAAKTARPGAAVSRTCVTAGPPCWPSTMPLGLSCGGQISQVMVMWKTQCHI